MQSKATTVADYLAELPEDRRRAIETVRKVILKNLDKGYAEGMQYGMIGYAVPHSIYPAGYHCDPKQPLPFVSLASQKNHMAVYLMSIYGDEGLRAWFEEAWAKTGKKLDVGKSCIRFKRAEDLALDVLGEAIRRVPVKVYLEHYTAALGERGKARAAKKPDTKASAAGAARPRKAATTSKPAAKPKRAAAEPAAPKKAASKKATPKKAAPKKAGPKKAGPKKVAKKASGRARG